MSLAYSAFFFFNLVTVVNSKSVIAQPEDTALLAGAKKIFVLMQFDLGGLGVRQKSTIFCLLFSLFQHECFLKNPLLATHPQ